MVLSKHNLTFSFCVIKTFSVVSYVKYYIMQLLIKLSNQVTIIKHFDGLTIIMCDDVLYYHMLFSLECVDDIKVMTLI